MTTSWTNEERKENATVSTYDGATAAGVLTYDDAGDSYDGKVIDQWTFESKST